MYSIDAQSLLLLQNPNLKIKIIIYLKKYIYKQIMSCGRPAASNSAIVAVGVKRALVSI